MADLLDVAIGIGFAAACGFRLTIPFLIMSLAVRAGELRPSVGFEWLGTNAALIVFGVASLIELVAYFIPWVDQVLELASSPVALAAGTILSASMIHDMSPWLKWTLAAIAGGGSTAVFKTANVALRTTSTFLTAGFGNFLVSIFNLIAAVGICIMAILAPLIALFFVVVGICAAFTVFFKRKQILWFLYKRREKVPRNNSVEPRLSTGS